MTPAGAAPPVPAAPSAPATGRARVALAPAARAAPLALAAVLGGAYLITAPPAADLAAATYRSDLLSRAGFTLWDNGWYGGHHLPGYSLLSPVLGALVGPRLLLVLSTLAATAVFAPLARDRFGSSAGTAAATWFALGTSVAMLSGRVPYTLGLALGLAALALALRAALAAALVLAVACSAASPVAGAFLGLAAVAAAVSRAAAGPRPAEVSRPAAASRPPRPGPGGWVAVSGAALLPVAALALAFPEGGYEPFAPSAFWPALAGVLAVAILVGPRQPALRAGAVLYGVAMTVAFAAHTPVGGNAARLGALLAGPLAAGVLWGRRMLLLALAAPALLYWQLATPARDLSKVAGDPSVHASYYAPLVAELSRLARGRPVRVEVPLTGVHWEADHLAGHVLLARGWERQLDTRYGALFYGRALGPDAYRAWLADNAVAYVALPDVRLDHAGAAEGRLVAGGAPFLKPVWSSAHWRLYAVADATSLVAPPGRLLGVGADWFTVAVATAGAYTVRVHFSPYWRLDSGRGCVARAPGDWTSVRARAAGVLRIGIEFAPARIVEHGPRCR